MLVYADTSVFGGVFDPEFRAASTAFFEQIKTGPLRLAVSTVVIDELQLAPQSVREILAQARRYTEILPVTADAIRLQQAYLAAGIISPKWDVDALHVALAGTSGCQAIVSWNFAHIVHHQKMPLYNAVNILHGFDEIAIRTPAEVITYED